MITEYLKDAVRAKRTAFKDILKSERKIIFVDDVKNDQIFNDYERIFQSMQKQLLKRRV